MRNERETAFCRLVPMRGKGMQFGMRRAPNPACALTHQSRRHASKQICDNANNCETFAHTSNPVNIDKIPPTVTLLNPAYVNDYSAGIPASVLFPPVTRFNDFALTISDNQAVKSVSVLIQYWDNSSETITSPLTLNDDHTTSAFTSGRQSFDTLITLKKSGTATITVTIRDTAGNQITPVYTIDTEFRPMLHLNTAGFVDFRTQSLVVTPQDFARTTPASADARYKKVGSTYNLMGTGAAITPNFHYILRNSAGTVVRDSNAPLNNAYMFVSGEGVLTLTNSAITNLSTLADGEYKLSAIYSDFLKNSSNADIPNVPENPDYASVAILLIDNTTAPSATNPASPQHLTFSPAVPAPQTVAASGHVGTRYCDSTGVAVSPKTVKVPQTQQNTSITFLKCKADVQATGFSAVGKRDIYILSAKQQASATNESLSPARQAMVMIAVATEGRGADNMTADGRIIRADVQAGTTDEIKAQAATQTASTITPEKITRLHESATALQTDQGTDIQDTPIPSIIAPSNISASSSGFSNLSTSLQSISSRYLNGVNTVYIDVVSIVATTKQPKTIQKVVTAVTPPSSVLANIHATTSALVGNVSPTQTYTQPTNTSPSSNNGVSGIQVSLNDIQQLSANKNLDTALSEAKNYGFTGSDNDLLQQLKKYYCNYRYTSFQKKLDGHCSSVQ